VVGVLVREFLPSGERDKAAVVKSRPSGRFVQDSSAIALSFAYI
jgi:hypothetical protein